MDLNKLLQSLNAQVVSGDILGAFDAFFADDVKTHSNPSDITNTKAQKAEALRWFLGNIVRNNRIELLGQSHDGDTTYSSFVFDFTNKFGENLVWHEVIRRIWKDGKVVDEFYMDAQSAAAIAAMKSSAKPTVAKSPATKTTPDEKVPTQKATPLAKAPETPAVRKESAPKTEKPAPDAASAAKATKATTNTTKADDLTLVEGIGPKIAELLTNAGIKTFADLAKSKPTDIKKVLDAAGSRYQMHDPATWPNQAALARDGKKAELQKLQTELKGGKK